jgi:hypothetical protein
MADKLDTDEEWNTARQIWAAGAVKIPAYPDEGTLHYLTDLKRAAATFLTAKSVTETDRQRTWSRERVAKQCRDLTQALYRIDELSLSRMAGASRMPITTLLAETLGNLAILESALINAREPKKPRKHKHVHNDFLVTILAGIYENEPGRSAGVTKNWDTNKRRSVFFNFVVSFAENFLPEHAATLNIRALERALNTRRDHPEP